MAGPAFAYSFKEGAWHRRANQTEEHTPVKPDKNSLAVAKRKAQEYAKKDIAESKARDKRKPGTKE